jgi:hypothetical protein
MAEYHELSDLQKKHANIISGFLDTLHSAEKRELEAIKHDYEAVKKWVHNHPAIAKSGATMAGLTGLYIAKKYKMGGQLPPPPRRF